MLGSTHARTINPNSANRLWATSASRWRMLSSSCRAVLRQAAAAPARGLQLFPASSCVRPAAARSQQLRAACRCLQPAAAACKFPSKFNFPSLAQISLGWLLCLPRTAHYRTRVGRSCSDSRCGRLRLDTALHCMKRVGAAFLPSRCKLWPLAVYIYKSSCDVVDYRRAGLLQPAVSTSPCTFQQHSWAPAATLCGARRCHSLSDHKQMLVISISQARLRPVIWRDLAPDDRSEARQRSLPDHLNFFLPVSCQSRTRSYTSSILLRSTNLTVRASSSASRFSAAEITCSLCSRSSAPL